MKTDGKVKSCRNFECFAILGGNNGYVNEYRAIMLATELYTIKVLFSSV